jgi:hypothetical protein
MSRASLAELEAVATVARAGGFRAAARELGVSSSGLSHAIAALEDRPHVRLFITRPISAPRSWAPVVPTELVSICLPPICGWPIFSLPLLDESSREVTAKRKTQVVG